MSEKAIIKYEKFLKIWGQADPVCKEPADARALHISERAMRYQMERLNIGRPGGRFGDSS